MSHLWFRWNGNLSMLQDYCKSPNTDYHFTLQTYSQTRIWIMKLSFKPISLRIGPSCYKISPTTTVELQTGYSTTWLKLNSKELLLVLMSIASPPVQGVHVWAYNINVHNTGTSVLTWDEHTICQVTSNYNSSKSDEVVTIFLHNLLNLNLCCIQWYKSHVHSW